MLLTEQEHRQGLERRGGKGAGVAAQRSEEVQGGRAGDAV